MVQLLGTRATESLIVHVDAFIKDLIPEYLEHQKESVKTMIAACERGDYETIRTLGHNMRGEGGMYGFDAITVIGGSLEQSAKGQNSEQVRTLVRTLSTYLDRIAVVYA